MQSLTRAGVSLGSCTSLQASRQPCQASTSSRVLQLQPVLARRSIAAAPRAVKDEQAELDRIVKEANQGDMWDNELVGNALKVALVAGIVAVAVFIGNLGEPIAENAIKSFPTPADYEAYEESK